MIRTSDILDSLEAGIRQLRRDDLTDEQRADYLVSIRHGLDLLDPPATSSTWIEALRMDLPADLRRMAGDAAAIRHRAAIDEAEKAAMDVLRA